MQKIDTVYCQPKLKEETGDSKNYNLWIWSRQDNERNYSIMDVRKGNILSRGGNKFARTTRLNKVIFDQTLSNFGLSATFRAKLSILITPVT